jgi:hypothetical protein
VVAKGCGHLGLNRPATVAPRRRATAPAPGMKIVPLVLYSVGSSSYATSTKMVHLTEHRTFRLPFVARCKVTHYLENDALWQATVN